MSAKQSRPKQTQSSSQFKSKKKSCCLCCFKGNASESSSEMYLGRSGEATDLLVEKMYIQRVPVRLFATEEDYRKMEAERSEKQLQPSYKPFEKYYSTLPKTDIKTVSETKIRPLEHSAISLQNVDVEILDEKFPFKERIIDDNERKLATAILNNLSSLNTLGSKGIPKDPCPVNLPKRSPNTLVNVSPNWRSMRSNAEPVKLASATLQVGSRDLRKELTPEMKDTLLMLGSAKKPGTYRFQKRLNRKVTNNSVASKTCWFFIVKSYMFIVYFVSVQSTTASYNALSKSTNLPKNNKLLDDQIYPTFNQSSWHDQQTLASVKRKLLESTKVSICFISY